MASAAIPKRLVISPATRDLASAEEWLREAGYGATDGVVAKLLMGAYKPGERAMVKVKQPRTADCVVGGFRYESGRREVGSLLLGLYNGEGRLAHVGFTATITDSDPPSLTSPARTTGVHRQSTRRAEPMEHGTSGEWESLRPTLVVEVRFGHVTGDRFRHGTKLIRWRPDKSPHQCTFEQLRAPLAEVRL
jgi:ATP-dependent DNA ligase